MKHLPIRNFITLLAATVFIVGCGHNEKILVEDHFKKDTGGWQIVGDAGGGSEVPQYSEKGGVKNGYIYAEDDVTGGVWYFSAPDNYLGHKPQFYGAILKFSLLQHSKMNNQFIEKDVIIKSEEKEIYHRIAPFPDLTWTHYQIPIAGNSGWRTGANKEAGEQEVRAVLDSITGFWIRGEYEGGSDTGGLDVVKIIK